MSRKFEYDAGVDIQGTRYRVVKALGAGGMGAVYEVEDLTVGRRFVMKTLHPELRDRADFVRRMEKEARVLARLNHPNIVQVFTAGVTEDALKVPYFIMERLEGQSLRMLVDAKGALPLHACYTIGIELLDALDRAHELGVIHRDVKPENVFIHRNGDGTATTKLLDFGIMSLLDREARDTGRRFVGTLRYAAPEQARGERVTPQSDLYAAGLVLYEMVAGRGPFQEAEGMSEIVRAHAMETPPPLSSFVACPPELDAVVMSALAKDPNERPRDAFAFAAVLRKLKRASKSALEAGYTGARDHTTAEGVVLALTATTPQPSHASSPSQPPRSLPTPLSASVLERTPEPPAAQARAPSLPKLEPRGGDAERARIARELEIERRRPVVAVIVGAGFAAVLASMVGVGWWWAHRSARATGDPAASAAPSSGGALAGGMSGAAPGATSDAGAMSTLVLRTPATSAAPSMPAAPAAGARSAPARGPARPRPAAPAPKPRRPGSGI